MDSQRLLNLLVAIPAFVAALTVHEFAHAWMGNRLGDDTARRMGRLTLDPLKHLDPFGSLMFVMGALYGYFFGWAKPVPFSPRNLSHPRRDSMLIAVAGPISNLLQLPVWLLLLWIGGRVADRFGNPETKYDALSLLIGHAQSLDPMVMILGMLMFGVVINLTIAAFNMIPLPPLDGHYVLEGLGPPAITEFFDMIRPFSFMILLVLINLPQPFNILSSVLGPVQLFAYSLIIRTLGLDFG